VSTDLAQVVRRISAELFEQADMSVAEELVHPDFFDHEAPAESPLRGPASVVQTVGWLHSCLSGLKYTVEDVFAHDDRAACRLTVRGRQTGVFLGLPPTGRSFAIQQIHLYRFVDGKVVEHWANRDDRGMLQQLGHLGATPSTR
jgi:hypothetical protein